MPTDKLLFKGHIVKSEDFVKAADAHSGAVTFYRIELVWGNQGALRVVAEEQAVEPH